MKISDLDADLDVEISNRIAADEEIDDRIDDAVEELNETIQTSADGINERIGREVDTIRKDAKISADNLLSAIANDKHYSIEDVSTTDKTYVVKDFTVNKITETVPDGEVLFDTTIGKLRDVRHNPDGTISSITLVTLENIKDKEVEHCFAPYSQRFVFSTTNKFTEEAFDGYTITFNEGETLGKSSFNLKPSSNGGRKVSLGSLTVGAIVDDKSDAEGKVVSGRLELVPGKGSALSGFNGRQFTFSETEQEYVFDGSVAGLSSKITVNPKLGANGNVHLKQDFSAFEAVPLRNGLTGGVAFGRIDIGEICPASVVVRIT